MAIPGDHYIEYPRRYFGVSLAFPDEREHLRPRRNVPPDAVQAVQSGPSNQFPHDLTVLLLFKDQKSARCDDQFPQVEELIISFILLFAVEHVLRVPSRH